MDYGSRYADKRQAIIEKRLKRVYREAQKELTKKLEKFVKDRERKEKEKERQLENGLITKEQYRDWRLGQEFTGKRWEEKLHAVTDVLMQSNKVALNVIRGEQFGVFSENANFQSFEFEKDAKGGIRFDIYDETTVARLVREKPELMPPKSFNGRKDRAWNQGIISNCITQGIIQGESINDIAKRITRDTASKNDASMRMYARTAMTSAQNAGRLETMHRAQDMGIKVKKTWMATLDKRTRHAHAELDGQSVDIDEAFVNSIGEIDYPGDPEADGENVWNCRCTLGYEYPDYSNMPEQTNNVRYDQEEGEEIEYMNYEDWKEWRESLVESRSHITHSVEGVDITDTWERRPNDFKFEIEDAINAQGFDGLPTVMRKDEFDKAVEATKIIAQRGYSADTPETLDLYKKELRNGKFFVECRNGHVYGKGMYGSISLDGKITEDMKQVSSHYSQGIGRVDSFTFKPGTRLANYEKLMEEFTGRRLYGRLREKMLDGITQEELPYVLATINESEDWKTAMRVARSIPEERINEIDSKRAEIMAQSAQKSRDMFTKCNGDIGTFGALRGYDGVVCNNDKFVVVYNRTKMIISEE